MATPAIMNQSPIRSHEAVRSAQLDLLHPDWNFPQSAREEAGAFALSFSPALVRYLIDSHSRPGDTVLDAFAGSGSTVFESLLMGREAIGVDCNRHMLDAALRRMEVFAENNSPTLLCGDARKLSHLIGEESVDLVVTQPPYGSTYRFSSNNPDDLSLLSSRDFLLAIEQVASELHTVMKPGGICALLIGDIKEHGRMLPLGFQFIHRFLSRGFSVKDIYDSRTPVYKLPVPLHNHEYLFIFQKKQKAPKHSR
ncbi:DNA methylase [Tumebacillus sp. BK434]|uniref:TRM11 family SAM-dependent methyltransferase n=1 Tax=Tumebacillus sp. BK434 TaxID=2512169 RepID=UPI001050A46F|nr:DNA methyltransferase [Tumebacillus sp. BK434]TCP59461.1 DNA methylase [Tumebacillus sp. BK434]